MNWSVLLLLFIVIEGTSCSQIKRKRKIFKERDSKENAENLRNQSAQEEKNLVKVVRKLDAGPSRASKGTHFQNYTSKWGLDNLSATHLYSVDWDADGIVDLVTLPEFFSTPVFFKGTKTGFKVVDQSPLPYSLKASFLNFSDFNKDGILDILFVTLNQKTEMSKQPLMILYGRKIKEKVTFIVEESAFPKNFDPTASISVVDINMDGWLDIYLGNWFDTNDGKSKIFPDRLYIGDKGGKSWKDGSYLLEGEYKFNKSMNIYQNATPSFGTSICDIDQNGYPDILVASSLGYQNKVWLNLFDRKTKERKFVNFAKKMNVHMDYEGLYSHRGGGHSFYMLCQDYNNNTLFDVAVGELFHSYDPETRDRSSILTNKGGNFPPQFLRTEYHKDDGTGLWSQGDRRGLWADLNFDGYIDLLIDNSGFPPKSRLVYFKQNLDHSFVDRAQFNGVDLVNPSGTVIADVDQDGRLDILSGQVKLRNSNINNKVYAFRNITPPKKRKRVRFFLKGKKANLAGIGATLRVQTNKKEFLRFVDYSYGPLNSQNESGVLIGLEENESIKKVEVRWPLEIETKEKRKYPLIRSYKFQVPRKGSFFKINLYENGKIMIFSKS